MGGGDGLLGGCVHAAVPRIMALGPGFSLMIGVLILEMDIVATFLSFFGADPSE